MVEWASGQNPPGSLRTCLRFCYLGNDPWAESGSAEKFKSLSLEMLRLSPEEQVKQGGKRVSAVLGEYRLLFGLLSLVWKCTSTHTHTQILWRR